LPTMLATSINATSSTGNYGDRVSASLGLRLRDEALASAQELFAERMLTCGCHDSDAYLRLLEANNTGGRREREYFTTRFTSGESYFLRDS
jgi:hypothetical protein